MMTTQLEPKKLPKPSGWKLSISGGFYTRSSKYGQRYMCVHCGRKVLGLHGLKDMHWPKCHRHPDSYE